MDFFEKYADRYDIDLTGATTREEKIEIFAKEKNMYLVLYLKI